MSLKDQVVIITGAGSGIGRATALLFAKEGAKVVVVDRNLVHGEATTDTILSSGWEECLYRWHTEFCVMA